MYVVLARSAYLTLKTPLSCLDYTVSIESESAYDPENLFPAAIRVLRNRISVLRRAVEALANGDIDDEDEMDSNVSGVGAGGPGAAVGGGTARRQDGLVNGDSRGVDEDVVMMES